MLMSRGHVLAAASTTRETRGGRVVHGNRLGEPCDDIGSFRRARIHGRALDQVRTRSNL